MNKIYDFIVIGAGISACTFASSLNKKFSDASILLVEHGRRLGGRSTTRKSRKNSILHYDHGLTSFSLSKCISQDLNGIISPLLKSKKLIEITNDVLLINEFSEIKNYSNEQNIYRGAPFMINFCEELINQSFSPKKINFLFETLIKSIMRNNYLWEMKINNQMILRSKNLILSSSLIAHPRSLDILNVNSLPLREAFIEGEDSIVDSVLTNIFSQQYIKRKSFIFHVENIEIAQKLNLQFLQINFSKFIQENFNFERVIFQRQSDGSFIIVLHRSYITKILELNIDKIIQYLTVIFSNHPKFLDLFLHAKLIDIMNWRASQPLNNFLPLELQWSSKSNIGFCGDWFHSSGSNGVESAMNSSIRLAKLIR